MPTAKKSNALRMSAEEFEAQAVEALGEKPGITLDLKDGQSLYIPHPATVDDDRLADIERVQSRRDLDTEEYIDDDGKTQTRTLETINGLPAEPFAIRFARAIIGPDEHVKFRAGGGKSAHVVLAWQYLTDKGDDDRAADPKPAM